MKKYAEVKMIQKMKKSVAVVLMTAMLGSLVACQGVKVSSGTVTSTEKVSGSENSEESSTKLEQSESLGESGTETVMENDTENESESGTETGELQEKNTTPKYIFLFIGDGMSLSQIQAAAFAKKKTGSLNFMDFPATGFVTTYSSNSMITDSAAAATAIATGNKTKNGRIAKDKNNDKEYTSIAKELQKKGYKIGIATTVSLNHATPACFYANASSRKKYYSIGVQLPDSGFDFFAGGGFYQANGEDGKQKNLYSIARKAGYTVVRGKEAAEKIDENSEKTILISERNVDNAYMPYAIDLKKDELSLKDCVKAGVRALDNEDGFFFMVEGGKIDLANHANDVGTMLREMEAFEESISVAIEFQKEHPEETLILVTGDHESGGLTLGRRETEYNLYPEVLEDQEISFSAFTSIYVQKILLQVMAFEYVIGEIENLYGVDFSAAEVEEIQQGYIDTLKMNGKVEKNGTEDFSIYGKYDPLTVTISKVMNRKAGFAYTTFDHTGVQLPVYALGVGSENFIGSYDNTEIYEKLHNLCEKKDEMSRE